MLKYAEYSENYRGQCLALHDLTFRPIAKTYYEPPVEDMRPDRTFICLDGKKVVGLGSYVPAVEKDMEYLQSYLDCARKPAPDKDILASLDELAQSYGGGTPEFKLYPSSFLDSIGRVEPTDYYFSGVCVAEKYRKKGIGTKLVEMRIDAARKNYANAIFVTAYGNGPSPRILERNGFSPILKFSPAYPDLSPAIVMGRFVS